MKRIIEIGTCLLVFLMPWQTRWIFQQGMINGNPNEYLTGSLYVVDVVIVLVVLLLAIGKYNKNILASISEFITAKKKTFSFFVILTALSFFWAENGMLAIQRLSWVLLATLVAFLVADFENKIKLIYFFLSGLMLSAWLGIWQFFAQSAFANKWLGLASHNIGDGGVSYLEIYNKNQEMTRWLRSYGSFDHPNIFGFAMALGIILALWLLHENKKEKLFLYVALVSFSVGLFASLSRSAFLALALAVAFVFFKSGFSKIAKPLKVLFFVFALLTAWHWDLVFVRSNLNARLEQKSIDERALYFHQGREIILENTFFGTGAGNYVQELVKKTPENSAWTYQPVHNVFLLVWAELGIFAMLSMLLFFAYLGLHAWKKGIFPFAIWLSLLGPLLLDHWLWDLHFGVILLGFVVGIIVGAKKNSELV